jgi:hypothetical protein
MSRYSQKLTIPNHVSSHRKFVEKLCPVHRGSIAMSGRVQPERVRLRYLFVVAGYVVMPEHVHLLVNEPQRALLSKAIQCPVSKVPNKTEVVILSERGPERFSVRGW